MSRHGSHWRSHCHHRGGKGAEGPRPESGEAGFEPGGCPRRGPGVSDVPRRHSRTTVLSEGVGTWQNSPAEPDSEKTHREVESESMASGLVGCGSRSPLCFSNWRPRALLSKPGRRGLGRGFLQAHAAVPLSPAPACSLPWSWCWGGGVCGGGCGEPTFGPHPLPEVAEV